ncbi:30S ribosomal protein S11 [Pseudomonadota bacterium]
MVKVTKTSKVSKKKRNILIGIVHVRATFNNTIISIADLQGNVIAWSSAGKMKFKGSRKATPYAAQVIAQDAIDQGKECGLQTVSVEIRGPGIGRESALRALADSGLEVTMITDKTYHPHNGCRAKKKRRQ